MIHVDKLTSQGVNSLKESFNNVPTTDHKDGKYRLRRYSRVELLSEPKKFKILEGNEFNQSSDYNKFQGDVERTFENLENETLQSKGMEEMLYLFRMLNHLPHETEVDIHQMRVITLPNHTAEVSPEGAHQDGYDCIAMFGIARYNISGGELLVSDGEMGKPFVSIPINEGTGVFLNDQALWHNASSLAPIEKGRTGYMDAFILTANK
tara:strand:- start:1164 stop:1787 length:624 start_codon:yes stop_codon:yes gene_type:complete